MLPSPGGPERAGGKGAARPGGDDPPFETGGRFERFTDRAREVVVLAREEARVLKHDCIGAEHLLLGVLREQQGLGGRVLESLDITIEPVRAGVIRRIAAGHGIRPGQFTFAFRAEKVFELALREALRLGHNDIGTEHILLGLVLEGKDAADHVLLDFKVDSAKIRAEVIRRL